MTTNKEQRQFSRVPFDCAAVVTVGESHWSTHLFDICLKGVLLVRPEGWSPAIGSDCRLEIKLSEDNDSILMLQVIVAHVEDDRVGVKCEVIDIDGISHLRRLVELNLGDPDLVDRELNALINS